MVKFLTVHKKNYTLHHQHVSCMLQKSYCHITRQLVIAVIRQKLIIDILASVYCEHHTPCSQHII